MSSALETFVRDRERVTAGRSSVSMYSDLAAHQLRNALGHGALERVVDLPPHLGDTAALAIDVARILELEAKLERLPASSDTRAGVIAEIERTRIRALAAITGNA